MDEIDLPEPIIHVVQSFLNSKDSARTTILSKSWRSAWLTRPNLDFDHADFCRSYYGGYNVNPIYPKFNPKFLEFAERTLERYESSNLIIDSFRLSMKHLSGVATGLVCRALKLRPTRLTFEFGDSYAFHIPNEVFRYENLLSLSAYRCRINLNRDEVCCSSLRFLSFNRIRIKRFDTMFRIISSCPLIEKLSLCNVYGDGNDDGMLMNITSPLHRLTSLVLEHVDFDTTFLLDDVSSKLPSLKDLTLHILSRKREEILISSPTLERLDFNIEEYYVSGYTVKVVKLDVPSINKLTFACSNLPDELSIASNSRGCESCVSLTRVKFLDASWFNKLSNFIDRFKFSRMSRLSLHVHYIVALHPEAGDIRGLSMPEIENLTILVVGEYMATQNCCALFDGLFQMCHPKVINIRTDSNYGTNIINFLVKRLLGTRDGKVPTPNQYYWMYGLNEYIKEARAQVLNATGRWRNVTLDSLLDEDSTTIKNNLDFRFHLNWKE